MTNFWRLVARFPTRGNIPIFNKTKAHIQNQKEKMQKKNQSGKGF